MVRNKLPEKWKLKISKEYIKSINVFRKRNGLEKLTSPYSDYIRESGHYDGANNVKNYEEISFEEFERLALNIEPKNKVYSIW